MQFAQILLTDDQALKTRLAFDLVLQDPERFVMTDDERVEFERLAVFFGTVAAHPSQFAPTGAMARTVKKLIRSIDGPAQPQSRRNKRKARQERRQGFAKRRRKERKEFVAAYNAAREQFEKDMEELAGLQAEQAEKLMSEPRYKVLDVDGQVLMSEIPESMVVRMDDNSEPRPELILPGSYEKALERES